MVVSESRVLYWGPDYKGILLFGGSIFGSPILRMQFARKQAKSHPRVDAHALQFECEGLSSTTTPPPVRSSTVLNHHLKQEMKATYPKLPHGHHPKAPWTPRPTSLSPNHCRRAAGLSPTKSLMPKIPRGGRSAVQGFQGSRAWAKQPLLLQFYSV